MSESSGPSDFGKRVFYFPLTRIIVGIIVCVFVTAIVNALLKLLLKHAGDAGRVARWVLTTVTLLAAYYFLFKYYEKRAVTELAKGKALAESLLGLLVGLLCVSIVILGLYVTGCYRVLSASGASVLWFSLIFFITGAALEEIIFRGVIYRIVEGSLGTNLALVISAALFGFAHIANSHAKAISVVSAASGGLLLGVMFSLTKRLWLPIAFHAGWNWSLASFGTVVSGNEELPTFLRIKLSGPEILTGGAFGPENSIITVVLVLIVSAALYYAVWKKGNLVKEPWRVKKGSGE